MTTAHRVAAAAFTLVVILGSSHASAATIDSGRAFREGIVLATSQLALEGGSDETSFNFARLRDLWIRVALRGTTSPIQLNLRLIDPQGMLIYEATVPYSSDPTITTLEVSGTGRPVAAFHAKTQGGGVALDYALPVSGSVVTRHLSEGTWTLVAEAGGRKYSASIDVSAGY